MFSKADREKIKSQVITSNDKVSVTIVNWNGGDYIKKCLDSLVKQTFSNIEVIVVDNASSDGSVEILEIHSSVTKLIRNSENVGFSKAHNQAIKETTGEYVIPLNFDIALEPDFISEMLKAAKFNSEVGIVSGKLYKKSGDIERIIDTTGITMNNMFPGDRGENEEDEGKFEDYEFVFGASGAAPLLKREMLEDIETNGEYFDEDFVYYVEDVDLCWRAQIAGWKCFFTPYAVGYHERGVTRKTSDSVRKGYFVIGYRNRYCAIFKNSFTATLCRRFLLILLREIYFYTAQVLSRNFFVLKVPFVFLKMIPAMIKKRRMGVLKRKVSAHYMENFFFPAH